MKNKFFNQFKKNLKDIDDAELGREIKRLMTALREPGGNITAHIMLAAKMLVFCCYQVGGNKLENEVWDLTVEGENVGDYKITVERIKK